MQPDVVAEDGVLGSRGDLANDRRRIAGAGSVIKWFFENFQVPVVKIRAAAIRAFRRTRIDDYQVASKRNDLPFQRFELLPLLRAQAGSRRITGGSSLYGPSGRPLTFGDVAAAYLAPEISLRDQEGFTSSITSLLCVLPSLPRRCRVTSSAVVSPITSAVFAITREARPSGLCFTRLAQRSMPAARRVAPGPMLRFVERLRALLSSVRVFPATWFPAPCHGGTCTRWAVMGFWSRRARARAGFFCRSAL